jgi:hypothetical protein
MSYRGEVFYDSRTSRKSYAGSIHPTLARGVTLSLQGPLARNEVFESEVSAESSA